MLVMVYCSTNVPHENCVQYK